MMNSWLRNLPRMQKGGRTTHPLWLSPDDAAASGLVEGAMVQVHNVNGALEAVVAFADALLHGAVAMCHGRGNRTNPGRSVEPYPPRDNVKVLRPSSPGSFEHPLRTDPPTTHCGWAPRTQRPAGWWRVRWGRSTTVTALARPSWPSTTRCSPVSLPCPTAGATATTPACRWRSPPPAST